VLDKLCEIIVFIRSSLLFLFRGRTMSSMDMAYLKVMISKKKPLLITKSGFLQFIRKSLYLVSIKGMRNVSPFT
jgi:hypothetical protein